MNEADVIADYKRKVAAAESQCKSTLITRIANLKAELHRALELIREGDRINDEAAQEAEAPAPGQQGAIQEAGQDEAPEEPEQEQDPPQE